MPEVPAGVASVVLTGRYIRPDGTPLAGTITFEPPASLVMADADLISVGAATAELDALGYFTITLIATDAPGSQPADWTYTVVERLRHAKGRTFHIALPAATPVVNLADIAPTSPADGDYVIVTGPPGADGSKIYSGTGAPSSSTGVDGDYYIDTTPGAVTWYGPKADGAWPAGIGLTGSGSAPVTSVAGKTGAVTLVAADVSGVATPGDITSAVSAHSAASDPHGDRAAATSALNAHVAAADPHGVKAYADGKFLPLAGGTMNGGLTSARSTATDTAFAFGLSTDTFDRARILASGRWELGSGTAARDTQWYRQAAAKWGTDSDVAIMTAGKGLQVREGTNAKSGTVTLVGGTATVANTSVTATSRIQLTSQADGGTPGWLRVSARTAGTSFTITSSSASDTSTVAYFIVEPAA